MSDENRKLIKFAREYLEYQGALIDEYQVDLFIVDDGGAGLYLIYLDNHEFRAFTLYLYP